MAVGSTTYYLLNPIGFNIADYEMAAIKYIYENNPKNNYVVISGDLPDYYLRKISANDIIGGNFPIRIKIIEGAAFERSIKDEILINVKKRPTLEMMDLALASSINNAEIVYLLLDSRFDSEAVRNALQIYTVYGIFDTLYVFKYARFHPHNAFVIADDNQSSFWTNHNPKQVQLIDDPQTKIQGASSLKVVINGSRESSSLFSWWTVQQMNWTDRENISFYFNGENTNEALQLRLCFRESSDYVKYNIIDNYDQWKHIMLDKNAYDESSGVIDWANVKGIEFATSNKNLEATWHLDWLLVSG
jgi:hypothetical protein